MNKSKSNKTYYEKNKKKILDRRKKIVNHIIEYKESIGCHYCGERFGKCLEFHHMDSEEKEINISKLLSRTKDINKIQKEIDKCILVCANCHRKLHYNKLILPKIYKLPKISKLKNY